MAEFAFNELYLTTRCWPAARIIGRSAISPKLEIAVTGKGRQFTQTRPAGFWRNFIAVAPDDETAVLDWVSRKGDPAGKLSPEQPIDTGGWPALAALLTPLARFWSESDGDGFSRVTGADEAIDRALRDVQLETVYWRGLVCRPAVETGGQGRLSLLIRAETLGDFMVCAAAFNLASRAAMKRCRYCQDHFVPNRSDALFCSGTCRSAYHFAREIEESLDLDESDFALSDHMQRVLANNPSAIKEIQAELRELAEQEQKDQEGKN